MPFFVQKGDLVSMNVDCIVNASNVNLSMVEGVGRAIYHKAGDALLAKACKEIGHCEVGDAVMTPSFGITNTKAIIHAVGPIYINGKHDEEENLISVYKKCLSLMVGNGYKSIAFPLLSGEFNYPLKECYATALNVFTEFLKTHQDINIYMVMYKNFPQMIEDSVQVALTKYIIDNSSTVFSNQKEDESFAPLLVDYIKKSGLTISDIAFRSNQRMSYLQNLIDSKNFALISKETIISIAVGLGLSKVEANSLLISKGFVFEPSVVSDLIVCYYLDKGKPNIFEVNSTLFQYNLKPLGSAL
ncbi:MAG: macro domain-containing protein [Bacilli bacterium]